MAVFSNPSVSIAICDDEVDDLNQIGSLTKELLESEKISYTISKFSDAISLKTSIEKGRKFNILLLDVMMDTLNGIDLAVALRERGNNAAIIFISCNRDMALLGYEVSAVRYLAKPLQKEKLREALVYCYQKYLSRKEILLPTKEGQCRILVSDIIYIEPWDRGTHLVLISGECMSGIKISEIEHILPSESFVFCHRTLLVNLAFIQSIRYCELTLKNGKILPVSKYRQAQVKERFLKYLRY